MPIIKCNKSVGGEGIFGRLSNYYFNQEARIASKEAEGLRNKLGVTMKPIKGKSNEVELSNLSISGRAESMLRNRNGDYDLTHIAGATAPIAAGIYALS